MPPLLSIRTIVRTVERSSPEARPDPSLQSPKPSRWESVTVEADDRTLRIHYVKGLWQALHSVEVELHTESVHLTVLLGLTPESIEHMERGGSFALMGLEEWTGVVLPEPVAGREIVGSFAEQRIGNVIYEKGNDR